MYLHMKFLENGCMYEKCINLAQQKPAVVLHSGRQALKGSNCDSNYIFMYMYSRYSWCLLTIRWLECPRAFGILSRVDLYGVHWFWVRVCVLHECIHTNRVTLSNFDQTIFIRYPERPTKEVIFCLRFS